MRRLRSLAILATAAVAAMAVALGMTTPPGEAPERVAFQIATGSSSGTY